MSSLTPSTPQNKSRNRVIKASLTLVGLSVTAYGIYKLWNKEREGKDGENGELLTEGNAKVSKRGRQRDEKEMRKREKREKDGDIDCMRLCV